MEPILRSAPTLTYMAEYYLQCVAKLKELIGGPDHAVKRAKRWITQTNLDTQIEKQKLDDQLIKVRFFYLLLSIYIA